MHNNDYIMEECMVYIWCVCKWRIYRPNCLYKMAVQEEKTELKFLWSTVAEHFLQKVCG